MPVDGFNVITRCTTYKENGSKDKISADKHDDLVVVVNQLDGLRNKVILECTLAAFDLGGEPREQDLYQRTLFMSTAPSSKYTHPYKTLRETGCIALMREEAKKKRTKEVKSQSQDFRGFLVSRPPRRAEEDAKAIDEAAQAFEELLLIEDKQRSDGTHAFDYATMRTTLNARGADACQTIDKIMAERVLAILDGGIRYESMTEPTDPENGDRAHPRVVRL